VADSAMRLPLIHQSETVGELILAPRARGESFSPADRRLVEDLARQAGVAVRAVRLTADLRRLTGELQRSREQLVTSREEERRRLRRDLHDGLGPTLAALMLKVGSARALFNRDPAAADALLVRLESDIEAVIAEIRRLVYNLRPPTLDDLGLVGALRDLATRYCAGRGDEAAAATSLAASPPQALRISLAAPDPLPPLPAAVEVAAYRIAQEGLTNVARHAHAGTCSIRLGLTAPADALELEIVDDGVGLPAERQSGVGLLSMHERARELGGMCLVEVRPGGGTRVLARLPLLLERGEGHVDEGINNHTGRAGAESAAR
jgi:signal transduction histidine kinase